MLVAEGEPGPRVISQGGPSRRPIDPVFALRPPTKPDDQRSRTGKDAMAEGCRGEAVKSAPRVLSRVPPSSHKARRSGAGFTVSAGSDTRGTRRAGETRTS